MIRRPPRSPLFPSTPLSRSYERCAADDEDDVGAAMGELPAEVAAYAASADDRNSHVNPSEASVAPSARRLYRQRLRSEEHTSELQSQSNLVCRLLLEKKKQI